jgi:uncharacterized protein
VTVLLRLTLRDALFAHWPVDEAVVAARLPPGVRPDTYDGTTYVGLVGVGMSRVRLPRLPPVPHLATFPQVNVRLYGVDDEGRQGVVFCTMDSPRVAGLGARLARLPYLWSSVQTRREGAVVGYEVRRRGSAVRGSLTVRVGPRVVSPTGLDDFLTARWGLFSSAAGGTWYLPLAHPPWELHEAAGVGVDPGLVRAAGFDVGNAPVSLLASPGVDAEFGPPTRVSTGSVR